MSVKMITLENFNEFAADGKTMLLDFYADWCAPCQMAAPLVHEIAEEHPEAIIGKVNVDEQPELSQQFGIMSIPCFVAVKNGEPVARLVGLHQKEDIAGLLNK